MAKTNQLIVKGISIFKIANENYITLTDIARIKNAQEPKDVVKNWKHSLSSIEFLVLCGQLNYPNFKSVELDSYFIENFNN